MRAQLQRSARGRYAAKQQRTPFARRLRQCRRKFIPFANRHQLPLRRCYVACDIFDLREPQHGSCQTQAFTFVPLGTFDKASGTKIDFCHGSVASK
jgi:hypothetical protein